MQHCLWRFFLYAALTALSFFENHDLREWVPYGTTHLLFIDSRGVQQSFPLPGYDDNPPNNSGSCFSADDSPDPTTR